MLEFKQADMNDIVGEEDDGTVTVLWFKLRKKYFSFLMYTVQVSSVSAMSA